MAIPVTLNAQRAADSRLIEPQLVLDIDGYPELLGAVPILKYIQYGDTDLVYGGGAVYGGLNKVENQDTVITFGGNTTTSIDQQLRPDQGASSSISSVAVSLVDKGERITRLISPGVEISDILGRKARLYFGFASTAFPDDYSILFRGIVDDIVSGPGLVTLNIAHPDTRKRQKIFEPAATKLNGALNLTDTTVTVQSTEGFLTPVNGPSGSPDPAIKYYFSVGGEVIRYTGKTATTFTGCTRAQVGTVAQAHDDEAAVKSFIVLEDTCVDLALKIMLSGVNGDYAEIQASRFGFASNSPVPNSIYFAGVNIAEVYGVTAGDYVTVTGASEAPNNITNLIVSSVVNEPLGSYVVIAGAGIVAESPTAATVAFRSRFDSLGVGLGMTPDEVDIEEHLRLKDLFLSGTSFQLFIKQEINGKDFIEKELYAPVGAYSLPRKARSSMGLTIGPVPTETLRILNQSVIKNAKSLQLRRTINRNFQNTVVYKYDYDPITDEPGRVLIYTDADSRNRIPVGNATRVFEGRGFRTALGAPTQTLAAATRLLTRYKFGAEYFENVQVFYSAGFAIEPGDIVVLEFDGLQVSNTVAGDRNKPSKFFEVTNKKMNLKTGEVTLTLVDTSFGVGERYGLIAPSSVVDTGSTADRIIIQDSFGARYPGDEQRKWTDLIGMTLLIHDEDFVKMETTRLIGFDPSNRYAMLVNPPLPSVPVAGDIVDLDYYPDSPDKALNRIQKLLFAHQAPRVLVTTSISDTQFGVSGADIDKFFLGGTVVVHDDEFTQVSTERRIVDITGNTITVDASLGFTPQVDDEIDFIGFPDEEPAYRII